MTIPEGVTTIGDYAFEQCSALSSVSLPASLRSIDTLSLNQGTALAKIEVAEGSPYFKSVGGVLFTGDGRRLICYPPKKPGTNYTIPDGVAELAPCAFQGCTMSRITFPESLVSLGANAFLNCEKLGAAALPDGVTFIGSCAFSGCVSLTKVTIPAGIKSITSSLFANCKSLNTVTIPEGVKEIGQGAFSGCERLTSISIPGSVTTVEYRAFYSCAKLSSVIFKGTRDQWAALKVGSGNESLTAATVRFSAS